MNVIDFGVTTCPERAATTLPRTMASLEAAGFTKPTLFVDGPLLAEHRTLLPHHTAVMRTVPVRGFGNWCLALHELTFRSPTADLYVLFQDDVLAAEGLREYLERHEWRPRTYLNLITYPGNDEGFGEGEKGWKPALRNGKGAQGLAFDRQAAMDLLANARFLMRRFDVHPDDKGRPMGTRNIDGGIHVAMVKEMGYTEFVHRPSLLDHMVDEPSVIGSKRQPAIKSWTGRCS